MKRKQKKLKKKLVIRIPITTLKLQEYIKKNEQREFY